MDIPKTITVQVGGDYVAPFDVIDTLCNPFDGSVVIVELHHPGLGAQRGPLKARGNPWQWFKSVRNGEWAMLWREMGEAKGENAPAWVLSRRVLGDALKTGYALADWRLVAPPGPDTAQISIVPAGRLGGGAIFAERAMRLNPTLAGTERARLAGQHDYMSINQCIKDEAARLMTQLGYRKID